MKVGVVGDTHLPRFGTWLPEALRAGLSRERVDLIVHVGDFTGTGVPALFEALAPLEEPVGETRCDAAVASRATRPVPAWRGGPRSLEAVAGNNDPPALAARFGRRKVLEMAGARLGLVHGDGRSGTTASRSLAAFADEPVDVICFGHSHQPLCERRQSTWLVNPGSPTDKRRQPRYSYAILDIRRGRVRPRLVFFDDRR